MMAYTGITNKTIQDYIGIVSLKNGNTTTEYLTGSTLFGICKTVSGTAEKVVEVEDFTTFNPTHGLTIHVLFYEHNTADNPVLKIGSSTAYPIHSTKTSNAGTTESTSWRDGAVVSLTFIDSRYDDDTTTVSNDDNDLSKSYWITNSSVDTGADGMASVNLANVNYADDLKLIEALTGSGYLKRDSTTSPESWSLDNTTFAEAATTLAGYGITDAKIDDGTITLGSNIITPLVEHQKIVQDGITGATINRYATSTQGASTAKKTASITTGTFPTTLSAGIRVTVKFSATNTASNPSLNINNTGDKQIYHRGSRITTGVNKGLISGICDFVYDGEHWCLVGNYYDTTYSRSEPASGGTTLSLVTTGDMYIWNNKQNALTFDGTYNASTNKVATESTITDAINALNVDNTNDITGFSNTRTLATLTETNGKIAATFQDIAFPITTVAGVSPASGTTNIDASSLLTALGLSSAMHYRGTVSADPTITTPSGTYNAGDVVVYDNSEYVCDNEGNWRELGSENSFKTIQNIVTDPIVSNNETATSFISNITQDANGVIAPIKKNLPIAAAGTQGIVSIATGTNILSITNGQLSHKTDAGYKHIPSGGSSGQFLGYSANGTATWVDNPNTHYTANIYTLGSSGTTILNTNTADPYIGLVENSNRNSAVQIKGGTNIDITGNNGIITIDNTYTLTAATNDALGGIQIGYSESNSGTNSSRNYAVKLSSNKAYVNVPWTDTKVAQNRTTGNIWRKVLLAYTQDDEWNTSLAADEIVTNVVYKAANISVNPSTGTLRATNLAGAGANITGITTNHIEGTGNGTKYLRQDGWKVVTVGVNADNTNGTVVTNVGFNQGTFPSLNNTGKAASFEVSGGILTITVGNDATLTTGTLPSLGTISKATLSINGADA